jgi:hypothetical protein
MRLDPGREYGPIMIRASGVTLDGQGARVVGPGHGVGVLLDGVSDVTVRALHLRGFDTGILIENGSHRNLIAGNDVSRCRDGLAIRALNGWASRDNRIEGNDFSHAAERGVFCASPGAAFAGNRANGCATGFLFSVGEVSLTDNEASDNRVDGIAFRDGAVAHVTLRGNRCAGNAAAGIAAVGGRAGQDRATHFIMEGNVLERNRWGIHLRAAHRVDLGSNRFAGNAESDVYAGPDTGELLTRPDAPAGLLPPVARLEGGAGPAVVGRAVSFDASTSVDPSGRPLAYRWDLGDGTVLAGPRARHVYEKPGVYRLGLTVTNGFLCALAWRDVHVVDRGLEVGTGGGTAPWAADAPEGTQVTFAIDQAVRLVGSSSIRARIEPYAGGPVSVRYPRAGLMGIPFSRWMRVEAWVRLENLNAQGLEPDYPVIALHETATRAVILTAGQPLLGSDWSYVDAPAHGDEVWRRSGDDISTVNWIAVGVRSHGREPLTLWLDGLGFGGR